MKRFEFRVGEEVTKHEVFMNDWIFDEYDSATNSSVWYNRDFSLRVAFLNGSKQGIITQV